MVLLVEGGVEKAGLGETKKWREEFDHPSTRFSSLNLLYASVLGAVCE